MTFWESLLLGLIQGLTEFLPVSSSGHLVIFQNFFGMSEPLILFDAMLHLGTLVAVFVVFWQDIVSLVKKPFSKEMAFIVIGTIPAVIAGVALNDLFENLFASVLAVCCALTVTGILMLFSDHLHGHKELKDLKWYHALAVGVCQAIAITPGLSRSGSTIFGSLLMGLNKTAAARYSFLLSIPIILGAGCKQIIDAPSGLGGFEPVYLVGIITAAVTGYLAIRFFLKILTKGKLKYFAFYCWGFALLALLFLVV